MCVWCVRQKNKSQDISYLALCKQETAKGKSEKSFPYNIDKDVFFQSPLNFI